MNQLHHAGEFRQILENYNLSESARQTLADLHLVLLVAPTSAGRNTIINELLKTGEYHSIVSDTTRQPRVNNGVPEQNGREYWFRTEEDMLDDLRRGEFLEAAIIHNQQVSGISIRELEKARQAGQIAINEIEVVGADNIHAAKPDAHFIFIVPPSFMQWMQRLHGRGHLPADEIRRRLESACKELRTALGHDYYSFVVNNKLEDAVAAVHSIATQGEHDIAHQADARGIAEQLYQDTQQFLEGQS